MPERALLSVKELSSYLSLSPCAVYRLVEKQEIPFIRRRGMGLRFRREAVDEWLEKSARKPFEKSIQHVDNKRNMLTNPFAACPAACRGEECMPFRGKSVV